MQLHVYDNNQQTGPFALEDVQHMFETGAISQNAHVWHEGAPDWVPVGNFLAEHVPTPVAPPAVARPMRFQPATLPPPSQATSEGALFLRAALSGLGVAVFGGLGWAALQAFGAAFLQLPYAIGIGLTFLCCIAIDKASSGSSGGLYLLLHFVCVLVLWVLGVFGVWLMGGVAVLGIYTLAGFILSLIIAWWKANN